MMWVKYIFDIQSKEDEGEQTYTYPVTDYSTDSKIAKQDPAKDTTEQSLISKSLDWDWKVAIDFGCGTGAHFNRFDKVEHKDSLLIGIDSDCSRAKLARDIALQRLAHIKGHVVCGGIEILENAPNELRADFILCSQVLGHVSTNQMKRIIDGFHRILRPGGQCAILIPIIGESFKDNPESGNWDGTKDFTHLVDVSLSPGDDGFRVPVSFDEFDKEANRPTKNILPVRSYLIPDFPNPTTADTPYSMDSIPESISSVTEGLFTLDRAILYSIHRDTDDSTAPIGDLIIDFRKP